MKRRVLACINIKLHWVVAKVSMQRAFLLPLKFHSNPRKIMGLSRPFV